MPNQSRSKDRWNDYFEMVLYLVSAGCFIFFLIRGVKAKMFEAALIIIVLTVIRGVVKITKTELFPILRFSILFFVFLTMLLANEFGFYGIIPHLDKIEHVLSGVILSFVGLLVFGKLIETNQTRPVYSKASVWFSLFFSVAMAGLWEVYEFTTDQLFDLHSQRGSLTDSMVDIICGTVGTIATCVYLGYKVKREKSSSRDHQLHTSGRKQTV